MKIEIFGPVDGPTGYDEVTRAIAFGLYVRGEKVRIEPFQRWSPYTTNYAIKPLIEYMTKVQHLQGPDVRLSVCLPEQVQPTGHTLNVLFSMFEADRIPRPWVDSLKLIDLIIVPTQFCKDAWMRSGVNPAKLAVVPIGIDIGTYNPGVEPMPLFDERGQQIISKYKYRFMNVQEVTARKNLDGLLKAWEIATNSEGFPKDDACLILKLNSYTGLKLRMLRERLDQFAPASPVHLYSRVITEQVLPKFYALCTHYISTSRGEGWGLSEHKCGALGKVVIAPAHTSYTTFLNGENAYMIPTRPIESKQDGTVARLYKGARWFDPDIEATATAIRDSLNDTERGLKLRKDIEEKFHIGVFVEQLRDQLIRLTTKSTALDVQRPTFDHPQVVHYCKTVGTECGIGNYTRTLYKAIQDKHSDNMAQMLVNGPDNVVVDALDTNHVSSLHLHLEYQFMSPARIAYTCREAKGRKAKVFVTLHTVNKNAARHHAAISDHADYVLVGSEMMRDEFLRWGGWRKDPNNVIVMPLACSQEPLKENLFTTGKRRFVIGFFGFSYFHKGIDQLILALTGLRNIVPGRFYLRIFSRKPKQDTVNFHEHCKWLINIFKLQDLVFWDDSYIEEQKLIQCLSACNVIVLPYAEHGGLASSAAARTALQAGTPILVSDTSFFADLPQQLAPRIDVAHLPEEILQWADAHDRGRVDDYQRARDAFVEENSFERIGDRHVELYRKVLNELAPAGDR